MKHFQGVMGMFRRGALWGVVGLFLHGPSTWAQVMDEPVEVPVTFIGEAYLDGWQGADYPEIEVSWQGGTLGSAFNWLWGAAWYSLGSPQQIQMVPGRVYNISVSGAGALEHKLLFDAPPGYHVYYDTVRRDYLHSTDTLGYVDSWSSWTDWVTYRVRVFRPEDMPPLEYSGQADSLRSHAVIWRVGMGRLMDGGSAGQLMIRESAPGAPLFTTDTLFYDDPSPEVEVILQSQKLRQVYANEALADIVTTSGTSYEIKFYHRSDVDDKSGGLYTFKGSPFVVYTIQRDGSDNKLHIEQTRGSTTWNTRLEKTGTTWKLQDWSSSSAHTFEEETQISSSPLTKRRITREGSAGDIARDITNEYHTYGWGQEMTKQTVAAVSGQSSQVTTFTYDAERLETQVNPDGSWVKYDYFDGFLDRGMVHRIYRPWKDSPTTPGGASPADGDVTTYTYTTNLETGWQDWPSNRERRINDVLAGRTTWSYSTPGALNGKATTQVTRNDYSNASNYVTTLTRRYWTTLGDPLYRGKILMERQPDGTQVSYAYERGIWNGSSFSLNSMGSDVRIWRLEGTGSPNGSDNSQAITSLGGQSIHPIYPVTHESTRKMTIRYRTGRIVREETAVYTGYSNFALLEVQTMDYTKWGELSLVTRPPVGGAGTARKMYEASFEPNGQKKQESDELATLTTFTYDARNRLSTSTHTGVAAFGGYLAQSAVLTTYGYDAANRLISKVVGPDTNNGIPTEWSYDYAGRVIAHRTARPGSTWYTTSTVYQDSSRRRTITYPGGATRIEDWLRDGRLETVTGTAQVTRHFSYDLAGDQTFRTRERYASGVDHEKTESHTDWLTRTDRVITTSFRSPADPAAYNRLKYHYNSSGQLWKETYESPGYTPSKLLPDRLYHYTNWGRLHQSGYSQDGTSTLTPEGHDRITEHMRRFEVHDGHWWFVEKDEIYRTSGSTPGKTRVRERHTRITGLNDVLVAMFKELDANGNETEITHTMTAGQRLLVIETSKPGADNPDKTHIRNGRKVEEVTSSGVPSKYIYDSYNRLQEIRGRKDPVSGEEVKTQLIYHVTSGSKSTEQIQHVRRWKPGTGWQSVETLAYNSAGRISLRTRIGGRTERFLYNTRGQVTRRWGTGVTPVEYEYNAYGRITKQHTYRDGTGWGGVSWPGGTKDTTEYTYDALTGLLTQIKDAAEEITTFTYNARGQLATRTWARGVTTTYEYYEFDKYSPSEFAGELKKISYTDSTTPVEFEYNRFGALSWVEDDAGTRTFTYRSDLQLDQENLPSHYGSSRVIKPVYQGTGSGKVNGRLEALEYGSSSAPGNNYRVSYTFQANTGRVATLQTRTLASSGGPTLTYQYQTGSNMLSQVSSSNNHLRTYTWQTWRDVLTQVQNSWNSNNRLQGTYVTADYNQYTQETFAGPYNTQHGHGTDRVTDWTYTDRGELATQSVNYSGQNHTVSYDNAQNRSQLINPVQGSTVNYTANNLNQYTNLSHTYDLDGNLTKDGDWDSLTYDAENRLVAMQKNNDVKLEFVYDYMGRRIQKQRWTWTGGSWNLQLHHRYVYNGWDLLAVLQSNGTTLVQTFAWGPTAEGGWGGAGGLAIAWEGGNHFFPVVDGRQNIVGYLNTSGGWKQTVELDAFGNTINDSGTVSFPFGYKGYFRDLDTGLYYLGHRYYNPLTGRFLNRDPIRERGGLNLYAHTRNDHINLWDVRGLSPYDNMTHDNSLWDDAGPLFSLVFRAISHEGQHYRRFLESGARFDSLMRRTVPISEGSGTLQPRRTLRGPILRHSQQEPGGDWSGLREGNAEQNRNLKAFVQTRAIKETGGSGQHLSIIIYPSDIDSVRTKLAKYGFRRPLIDEQGRVYIIIAAYNSNSSAVFTGFLEADPNNLSDAVHLNETKIVARISLKEGFSEELFIERAITASHNLNEAQIAYPRLGVLGRYNSNSFVSGVIIYGGGELDNVFGVNNTPLFTRPIPEKILKGED